LSLSDDGRGAPPGDPAGALLTAAPHVGRLQAPATWRQVDLISDLHLGPELPRTAQALLDHLRHTPADAVLLLGDIFEVWVGDDLVLPMAGPVRPEAVFEHGLSLALAEIAASYARSGRLLGFMAGNRDFLVGPAWLAATGITALADPTRLDLQGRRWLLSHGDALCLDDEPYQRFRAEVRSPAWQQTFLARPLDERLAMARQMRQASQARHAELKAASPGAALDELYADVDHPTARAWLSAAGASTIIHGHTHRPAAHALGEVRFDAGSCSDGPLAAERLVLSDWDLDHGQRAEVLRLDALGAHRLPPSSA
jgi:UDP-2,3-diacylglucosamine hydrolase